MVETLRALAAGTVVPRPQDHAAATLAPMLKKEDGRIEWNLSAEDIFNRMRGFLPWPRAYTFFRGQSCHLRGEPVSHEPSDEAPGTLLLKKNELQVACGNATVLRLLRVKLEGRKEIGASEFANGAHLKPGERFGDS
jgi:methionyl-tRNA formyltransferase